MTIHYRIANLEILRAFDIMREVLFEQLAEGRRLVNTAQAGARRRKRKGWLMALLEESRVGLT